MRKITDIEKLTDENKEAYFSYLWQQQGLLLDFGVEQILGRTIYFANFQLGFGVRVEIHTDTRKIRVHTGNSELKEPTYYRKDLGFEELRLENHATALHSLGLTGVFSKILQQANFKTA